MPLTYFLYARKSSESEDRQMASIDDQISEMTQLAKTCGLVIVDIISESGSAKEPGREKFNQMLTRIQRGEAQGILCWKLNRLARNPVDGGQISWLLQQHTIKHIKTYGQEYRPEDNVLMMQVEFGMANQFVKDLSVDVKRGMRKKAERGWYPAATPPLGYRHNPDKQYQNGKEIIKDPKRFPLAKKLWDLFLTGDISVAEITRRAASLGLVSHYGKAYSKQAFFGMFTNEFYCGYFEWTDSNGQPIRIQGKHEAMISRREFNQVQNLLRDRSFQYPKNGGRTFDYSGLITCGECGRAITCVRQLQAICPCCKHKFSIKNRSDCPRCRNNIRNHKKVSTVDRTYHVCTKYRTNCSQRSVQPDELERQIIKVLDEISIEEGIYNWMIIQLKQFQEEGDRENQALLTRLKKRRTELSARLTSLIELRADGEISSDEMSAFRNKTLKELADIEAEIQGHQSGMIDWFTLAKDRLTLVHNAKKRFLEGDVTERRMLLQSLLLNLSLRDKKLYYTTQNAISVIEECALAYNDVLVTIEPANTLDLYDYFDENDPLHQLLWTKLNELRTCLSDMHFKL